MPKSALFWLKVNYSDLTLQVQTLPLLPHNPALDITPITVPQLRPLGTTSMLGDSRQMILSDVLLRGLSFCKFTAFTSHSPSLITRLLFLLSCHCVLLPLEHLTVAEATQFMVVIWNHEYNSKLSLHQLK